MSARGAHGRAEPRWTDSRSASRTASLGCQLTERLGYFAVQNTLPATLIPRIDELQTGSMHLIPPSVERWGSRRKYLSDAWDELLSEVDQVICDHSQTDPTLHPVDAVVSASRQSMSTFYGADAPLASGAPALAILEPAPFL